MLELDMLQNVHHRRLQGVIRPRTQAAGNRQRDTREAGTEMFNFFLKPKKNVYHNDFEAAEDLLGDEIVQNI